MKMMERIWNSFRSRPDIWFFYAFLATFTLSIRKVLVDYPIAGQFNEWTGVYLYLSDIFLVLTPITWVIYILRHDLSFLSMNSLRLWLKQAIIYLPLLLVIWAFISILWSINQNIALFKAIKFLELFFLYLFIIYRVAPMFHVEHQVSAPLSFPRRGAGGEVLNVPRGTILRQVFQIIIAVGFIQAVIGIWQFVIQHSIGLSWLFESQIASNIDGVAKLLIDGEKFIRIYGLFPHPNILGGFLLISIVLTWSYIRLFHVEQNKECHPELDSGSNSGLWLPRCFRFRIKSGMTLLLAIQIIALVLTFSKSAIVGLILALGYLVWNKMFHVEHLSRKIILLASIIIVAFYLGNLNIGDNLGRSYGDRVGQIEVWTSTISNISIVGSGIGNYMFHVEQLHPNLMYWQYQPVHNVFLLILAELGIVGIFIFIWFLWKMFHQPRLAEARRREAGACPVAKNCSTPVRPKNVPRGTFEGGWNNSFATGVEHPCWGGTIFRAILLGLAFIILFDHYLWDIQQGQIMLWMVLGLLAGSAKIK